MRFTVFGLLLHLAYGSRTRVPVRTLPEDVIRSLVEHVEPEYADTCEAIFRGRAYSFSQAWQDWTMFHHYFVHENKTTWGDGYYMDFGSNDPVVISNTLFFDKCLGWKGLCIEMQVSFSPSF